MPKDFYWGGSYHIPEVKDTEMKGERVYVSMT